MITLYGSAPTRATRVVWMLEELGVDYELLHELGPKSPELRAANPNAKVPVLEDDGFFVWESMAINLYLGQRYGGELWPETLEDQTRASMWSFWVMTELERPLLDSIGPGKDGAAGLEEARRPLGVLEGQLANRDYILGPEYTVADVNVTSVLALARVARWNLSEWSRVDDWLGRCLDRPAARKLSQIPWMPPP